ncbi:MULTISPECIES: DUF2231 domain-containing protein [unclassified Streptomyces]|uniref:DUF2231 domain-containing protein n=1 Tax=unclassified Streptomyces TaxID=2593676 RepID=UPI00224FF51D|nr:DUF2231 domain-containing protein [Streptomyces sp. NBC_00047]MCX5610079.1 hypothetical protein [Streptomyces sp. NBC_00047]
MNAYARYTSPETKQTSALETASAWWLTALDRIERTTAADPAIRILQRGIRSLPLGEARDLLRGRPLGHPLHPVLVQVPIGCWLSAAVLDVVPGAQRAATTLTAVGLAGVAPAAIAGWADWADLPPAQARVGLAHAVTNVAAVACYTASLTARLRSHSAKGRLWSWGGLTAVAVSGALGGHVAYRQAVGALPAT